jgi:hypothetical protein
MEILEESQYTETTAIDIKPSDLEKEISTNEDDNSVTNNFLVLNLTE